VDIREFIITNSKDIINDCPQSSSLAAVTSDPHGARGPIIAFCGQSSRRNSSSAGPGSSSSGGVKEDSPSVDLGVKRLYIRTGSYKGNVVAIKAISSTKNVNFTKNICKELKQMTSIRHENVVSFMGVSVDYGSVSILTAYCARGSLEDVLKLDFKLDTFFIASLVTDLIKVCPSSQLNYRLLNLMIANYLIIFAGDDLPARQ
jgi:guanylate cyclase